MDVDEVTIKQEPMEYEDFPQPTSSMAETPSPVTIKSEPQWTIDSQVTFPSPAPVPSSMTLPSPSVVPITSDIPVTSTSMMSLLTTSISQSSSSLALVPDPTEKILNFKLQISQDGGLRLASSVPMAGDAVSGDAKTPPKQMFFVKNTPEGHSQLYMAFSNQPKKLYLLQPSAGHELNLKVTSTGKVASQPVVNTAKVAVPVPLRTVPRSGGAQVTNTPQTVMTPQVFLSPKKAVSLLNNQGTKSLLGQGPHNRLGNIKIRFVTKSEPGGKHAQTDTSDLKLFNESRQQDKDQELKQSAGKSMVGDCLDHTLPWGDKASNSSTDTGDDDDDHDLPFKIDSVFSLASGEDQMPDFNWEDDKQGSSEETPIKVEDCYHNSNLTQQEMLEMCGSSFVVLERLTQDVIDKHGDHQLLSRCSDHCRQRTLNYLCMLGLIRCHDKRQMSFDVGELGSEREAKVIKTEPLTDFECEQTLDNDSLKTSAGKVSGQDETDGKSDQPPLLQNSDQTPINSQSDCVQHKVSDHTYINSSKYVQHKVNDHAYINSESENVPHKVSHDSIDCGMNSVTITTASTPVLSSVSSSPVSVKSVLTEKSSTLKSLLAQPSVSVACPVSVSFTSGTNTTSAPTSILTYTAVNSALCTEVTDCIGTLPNVQPKDVSNQASLVKDLDQSVIADENNQDLQNDSFSPQVGTIDREENSVQKMGEREDMATDSTSNSSSVTNAAQSQDKSLSDSQSNALPAATEHTQSRNDSQVNNTSIASGSIPPLSTSQNQTPLSTSQNQASLSMSLNKTSVSTSQNKTPASTSLTQTNPILKQPLNVPTGIFPLSLLVPPATCTATGISSTTPVLSTSQPIQYILKLVSVAGSTTPILTTSSPAVSTAKVGACSSLLTPGRQVSLPASSRVLTTSAANMPTVLPKIAPATTPSLAPLVPSIVQAQASKAVNPVASAISLLSGAASSQPKRNTRFILVHKNGTTTPCPDFNTLKHLHSLPSSQLASVLSSSTNVAQSTSTKVFTIPQSLLARQGAPTVVSVGNKKQSMEIKVVDESGLSSLAVSTPTNTTLNSSILTVPAKPHTVDSVTAGTISHVTDAIGKVHKPAVVKESFIVKDFTPSSQPAPGPVQSMTSSVRKPVTQTKQFVPKATTSIKIAQGKGGLTARVISSQDDSLLALKSIDMTPKVKVTSASQVTSTSQISSESAPKIIKVFPDSLLKNSQTTPGRVLCSLSNASPLSSTLPAGSSTNTSSVSSLLPIRAMVAPVCVAPTCQAVPVSSPDYTSLLGSLSPLKAGRKDTPPLRIIPPTTSVSREASVCPPLKNMALSVTQVNKPAGTRGQPFLRIITPVSESTDPQQKSVYTVAYASPPTISSPSKVVPGHGPGTVAVKQKLLSSLLAPVTTSVQQFASLKTSSMPFSIRLPVRDITPASDTPVSQLTEKTDSHKKKCLTLEERYPLPSGVVIKSEPETFGYPTETPTSQSDDPDIDPTEGASVLTPSTETVSLTSVSDITDTAQTSHCVDTERAWSVAESSKTSSQSSTTHTSVHAPSPDSESADIPVSFQLCDPATDSDSSEPPKDLECPDLNTAAESDRTEYDEPPVLSPMCPLLPPTHQTLSLTNSTDPPPSTHPEIPVTTSTKPTKSRKRKRRFSKQRTPSSSSRESVKVRKTSSPQPDVVDPVTTILAKSQQAVNAARAVQSSHADQSSSSSESRGTTSSERIKQLKEMLRKQNEQLEQIRMERALHGPVSLHND